MNFQWSNEQVAFREKLLSFLEENIPANWNEICQNGPASREVTEFAMHFCPKLAQAGLLVPHWPTEYGGVGSTPWLHFIIGEELWAIGEPRGGQYMNVNWIGPTIIAYGTEHQKRTYLPEIAQGSVLWCQGFSEPSAGSDLAALRTMARASGDCYVINGSKVWTSYAGLARHCFLLARTSAEGKRAISIFLISMDTPGISVRPIPSLVGEGDIHEVFFDNVHAPREALLGAEGQGWQIVRYALANERVGIARYELARRTLHEVVATLKRRGTFNNSAVRHAAANASAACEAARLLVYKVVDGRARARPANAESSLARWAVVVAEQNVTNFALQFLPDSFSGTRGSLPFIHHERAIAAGLGSGAAEIQLGIVASEFLELPREARA
jgi:alkylation response protein AidB-like acyl-CoA dehydrogenase